MLVLSNYESSYKLITVEISLSDFTASFVIGGSIPALIELP